MLMSEEQGNELLTVEQAAREKGVSESAVYLALTEGRLAYELALGRRGVRRSALLAWEPRSYRAREGAKVSGRPPGIPQTEEGKANISKGQKKRWEQSRSEPPESQSPKNT